MEQITRLHQIHQMTKLFMPIRIPPQNHNNKKRFVSTSIFCFCKTQYFFIFIQKSEQSDPSASAYKNLKQPAQNDANAYKNHESTSDSKEVKKFICLKVFSYMFVFSFENQSETVKSDEPVSATNYKNATTSTPESVITNLNNFIFIPFFFNQIQSDNSVAYKNVQQNNSSTENSEPSSTAYKNSGNNASQEENKPTQTQKPREIVEARKADLLQGARNWNEDFQNVLKIKGLFFEKRKHCKIYFCSIH